MAGTSVKTSTEEIFSSELDELIHEYLSAEPNTQARDKIRDQIVGRVMPYVKRIAYGLARRSTDPAEDLIQVGNIGLLKAVDKFNPLVGSSFKTYATYFITGEIRHYLRDKTAMIKAPRQMYELYYRMNLIVQQLTDEYGRTPTDVEIARELECPVKKIDQAKDIERRRQLISLDTFALSDGSSSDGGYLERLVDETQTVQSDNHETRMVLENALASLKDELSSVVRMTYFEDMSQTEIAEQLGISQMQVSRRLRKALDLLSQKIKVED